MPAYVLADHYLHISGVVAVVVAALTVAAYGPTHLHPRRWTSLRQLWTQLDFWSNCLIFILASMLAANVLSQITWLYVWALLAVAIGAFVARVLVVFGMLPLLELSRLVQPVEHRVQGDPGLGRPARRGDHRARHGRGERWPAVGQRARVRRRAGDAVRARSPCSSTPPRSAW